MVFPAFVILTSIWVHAAHVGGCACEWEYVRTCAGVCGKIGRRITKPVLPNTLILLCLVTDFIEVVRLAYEMLNKSESGSESFPHIFRTVHISLLHLIPGWIAALLLTHTLCNGAESGSESFIPYEYNGESLETLLNVKGMTAQCCKNWCLKRRMCDGVVFDSAAQSCRLVRCVDPLKLAPGSDDGGSIVDGYVKAERSKAGINV